MPLPEIKHTKLHSFEQLSGVDSDAPFRLRGYVVSVSPAETDTPIYYCNTCKSKTHQEVCSCLTETDLKCPLSIVLWNGESDSRESLRTLVLSEDDMQAFFARLSFDQAKELLLHPYHNVEVGVRQAGGTLQLVHSRLVSIS